MVIDSYITFNPILVWFYQRTKEKIVNGDRRLSIPFWSDFISGTAVGETQAYMNFQSHFGLILSVRAPLGYCLIIHLSIPFWSDFILLGSVYCFHCKVFFQSHFGLILSKTKADAILRRLARFQSHFGLILSCCSLPWRRSLHLSFNPTMVWFYLLL